MHLDQYSLFCFHPFGCTYYCCQRKGHLWFSLDCRNLLKYHNDVSLRLRLGLIFGKSDTTIVVMSPVSIILFFEKYWWLLEFNSKQGNLPWIGFSFHFNLHVYCPNCCLLEALKFLAQYLHVLNDMPLYIVMFDRNMW